jgi:hypothetical protein
MSRADCSLGCGCLSGTERTAGAGIHRFVVGRGGQGGVTRLDQTGSDQAVGNDDLAGSGSRGRVAISTTCQGHEGEVGGRTNSS